MRKGIKRVREREWVMEKPFDVKGSDAGGMSESADTGRIVPETRLARKVFGQKKKAGRDGPAPAAKQKFVKVKSRFGDFAENLCNNKEQPLGRCPKLPASAGRAALEARWIGACTESAELLPKRGRHNGHDALNLQMRTSEMNPSTNTARPQRILYIDHTAKLGGGEIALLSLVTHVSQADFEPVVVLGEDGPLREKLCAAGIETHVLPLSPSVRETRKDALGLGSLLRLSDAGQTLAYARRLARFIRAERIALVHTNSLKSDLFGGLAARLARVPLVWHVRDRIDENYLPRPVVWSFRRLCRWVPDYIIANSQSTLETLALPALLRSEAVSSRCGTIYSGLTARPPLPEIPAGLRWAPAPSRSAGTIKIGLIGRISPWKGQHIFLGAAAEVRRVFPGVRFQIIGSALFGEESYEREIRELVRHLELEDCVEFLGFREDVPRLVADLDIVVHASTSPEPFGQVIVEGMMAGKPVVATDAGGPREIVVAGETGLLVPVGDAAAMAEAIVSLLRQPETAREMGRRGYARACRLFSIEKTVENVELIYHHLLTAAERS